MDLPLLRDAGIGILRQQLCRLLPVIARGRSGEHIPHGVEEGVEAALGDVDLHIGPGVDEPVVGRGGIGLRIGVLPLEGHRQQGGGGHQTEQPPAPILHFAGQEENRPQQARREADHREPHQPGNIQGVAPHNALGLGGQAQVGGQQGVAAQADLVVVHQGQPHSGEKAAQKGGPGPAEQEVKQPHQAHGDGQIQHRDQGLEKIGGKNGVPVQLAIGEGRQQEGEGPDAAPQTRDAENHPHSVDKKGARARVSPRAEHIFQFHRGDLSFFGCFYPQDVGDWGQVMEP